MLTLRQLRQFLAVADTMSFRRAAEQLDMAQPPLTAAIRQMEDQLGARLFERTNRISSLTAAGVVLREEALKVVAQVERATELTKRAGAGLTGALRIGFVSTAVRDVLPPLLADYRTTHPDVLLELIEAPTARQVDALLEDRLDLGVVAPPLPSGVDHLLQTRIVLRSEFVAALPRGHPLARKSSVPLAALAKEPWILFPEKEGPGLHERIMSACGAAGFQPQVVQRAIQMDTAVGLVGAGFGIALVPKCVAHVGWGSVDFRPLAGSSPAFEVALVWRRDNRTPVLRALLGVRGAKSTTGRDQRVGRD